MPRSLVALVLSVLAASSPVLAQRPGAERGARATLRRGLDSLAAAAGRAGSVPGISIAVVRARDTVALGGYGLADLESDAPATAATVYRIGSLTKQFTASAVMRLVEAGRIGLDDSLAKYLPDYPAATANRVRVRNLLNHTSGIPSYTGIRRFWQLSRLDLPADSIVALFKDLPLEFEPGTRWRYDNSGYYLLGLILERVTGERYADHLRRTIFEPLALAGTRYCDTGPVISHRAQGYGLDSGRVVNAEPIGMGPPFAAGALCSTAGDLVRWEQALMGGQVVSAASLAMMISPTTLAGGGTQPYGFGLGIGTVAGHRAIAHGGSINGFESWLTYLPDDTLIVAVLMNRENANPAALAARLARRALGIAEPVVLDLPRDRTELARYAGSYASDIGGMEVAVEGTRLHLHGAVDTELRYQGGDRFVSAEDPDVQLAFRPEGGSATGFTLTAGGRAFEVRRTP